MLASAVSGDQISHQALVALAVFAENHHGLANAGAFFQQRLNLAGLDAMAAQLDLIIGAAQEIDVAVGKKARQIAGAINPPNIATIRPSAGIIRKRSAVSSGRFQ